MKIYQPRLARLQLLALILPAQAAHAFDPVAFEAMAIMRASRATAAQRIGAADTEMCNTILGVQVCQLTWRPFALLTKTGTFSATFVGDLLVSKSITQPCTKD